MMNSIKKRVLASINTVVNLKDYLESDCIFSIKYGVSPTCMTYILLRFSQDFNFTIDNDFVDNLEMCTFAQLEALLVKYENTKNSNN